MSPVSAVQTGRQKAGENFGETGWLMTLAAYEDFLGRLLPKAMNIITALHTAFPECTISKANAQLLHQI